MVVMGAVNGGDVVVTCVVGGGADGGVEEVTIEGVLDDKAVDVAGIGGTRVVV